jgi:hypothetical protein
MKMQPAKMGQGFHPVVTTQLAHISCKRLADLMKERREAMLHVMAKQRAKGDAEARIQSMSGTMALFEQIDFVQQTQGDAVTWILRVQTTPPKE